MTPRRSSRRCAAFPHIQSPESKDICYATTNRQLAVRELADQCDLVLVVGSKNSSNSQRLVETAEQGGVTANLIDDVSCMDTTWLDGAETILITAGASAPEHLVAEVVEFLQRQYGATVEERDIGAESLHFELPLSLRRLELQRSITPETSR